MNSNENSYTFEVLGKIVEVKSNDQGSHLEVRFDGVVIEDSYGECIQWPNLSGLSGAARSAACHGILKQAAEASLAQALLSIAELYAEPESY